MTRLLYIWTVALAMATLFTSEKKLDSFDKVALFLNNEELGTWTEQYNEVHFAIKANPTDTLKFAARTDWGGLDSATIKISDSGGQLIKIIPKTVQSQLQPFAGIFRTDLKFIDSLKDKTILIYIHMQHHRGVYTDRYIFNLTIEKK